MSYVPNHLTLLKLFRGSRKCMWKNRICKSRKAAFFRLLIFQFAKRSLKSALVVQQLTAVSAHLPTRDSGLCISKSLYFERLPREKKELCWPFLNSSRILAVPLQILGRFFMYPGSTQGQSGDLTSDWGGQCRQ